ncbi:DUF4226 domain-containing protein [Nocardia stercoris]|uniref:DUF4226 domain-containing protein n=1 Tax=Nocardia stercoris TaxID=2483361 RepID=A0A3M2KWE0_9NOCA|nr:DUF4226 domain-containing protein [Nocardia stercoris]
MARDRAPGTHDAAQQPDQLIAQMLPQLLQSGLLMLAMLPQLTGSQNGADGSGGTGGLSPQAQRTLQVLEQLKQAYGNGTLGGPDTGGLGTGQDSGADGGSATAQGLSNAQLYQKMKAQAYDNLDNQLAHYLTGIAGSQGIDQKAMNQVIQQVDVDLAHLGTSVYTKQGEQQVHDILAAALQKAQGLISGSAVTADETAAAIDALTGQYLYNIHGLSYPGPSDTGSAGSTAGSSAAVQQAVNVALSEIGKPYVHGGNGPDVFDCSGLTSFAARAAGVEIPRTAAEQYQQLPHVNPADIQPGDLIFPGAEFNGGAPGHVMMYLGNGQCVAAPYPGQYVRVEPLPSSYAASRWAV